MRERERERERAYHDGRVDDERRGVAAEGVHEEEAVGQQHLRCVCVCVYIYIYI